MWTNVKEFLKTEDCQRLLEQENLSMIFQKWVGESGGANLRPLIKFFKDIGIEPLEYLKYLPFGYFYHESPEILKIPDNITMLQNESIYKCNNLKELHLPTSIQYMHDDVVYDCKNLEKVVYAGTVKQFLKIRQEAFCNTNIEVHCTDGVIDVTNTFGDD